VTLDAASVVGPDGWATWETLTTRIDRKTIAAWVMAGRLVHLHTGVYALPRVATDWRARVAAAVEACGGVASHRTALGLWGLAAPAGPIHLTVELGRSGRGPRGVVLHRTRELVDPLRRVAGLPTTCVERAIVDCWGSPRDLARTDVRAAAIDAVRQRMATPGELTHEIERRPCLPGRGALVELVRLLAEGCRSELEIWGCLQVLRGPGMPAFALQRRVEVGGRVFFLDAACDDVKLAVEMDGAAYHGSPTQRESDIARDALLATIGWQTLRFSYRRMTAVPDSCRGDIRAAYQARRRLFGLDGVR
jgi:very-short-patch-repair endonuclease